MMEQGLSEIEVTAKTDHLNLLSYWFVSPN